MFHRHYELTKAINSKDWTTCIQSEHKYFNNPSFGLNSQILRKMFAIIEYSSQLMPKICKILGFPWFHRIRWRNDEKSTV